MKVNLIPQGGSALCLDVQRAKKGQDTGGQEKDLPYLLSRPNWKARGG